jgi:leader peptidase (prepilin peptidase)/N-methyltransferase
MDAQPLSFLAPLLAAWLFFLGLCVGSFLNVVIARVPYGESIVRPRSRCPKCGHQLSWFENIPLLSWIALRGRCRNCKAPISARYPMVELLTGLLFLACLRRFDWTYELVPALVLIVLLVPLTFIDLEHWILPEPLTHSGIVMGLALAAPMGLERLRDAAIGAAVGFLSFRLMEYLGWKLFRKEALGGGDKYLVALLGAFLTWKSLLGLVFFSSLQGAVVGLVLLALTGRAGPRPEDEVEASAPGPTPDAQPVHAAPSEAQSVQPTPAPIEPPAVVEAQVPHVAPGDTTPAQPASLEQASTGQPTAVQTSTEQPVAAEQASTEQASTGQPATEQPSTEQASNETEQEPELTMTWDFTRPGLPLWRRILLVPYSLLFQPIPDAPVDEEGEEVDWVPGETNIPFGPWLSVAALEILLLGPWLSSVLPREMAMLLGMGR